MMSRYRSIGFALAAALLFGVSTPAAKSLVARADPWLTAGLLYLGSGTGLGVVWLLRRSLSRPREAPLRRAHLPWLAAAIASGGVVAPVLLMFGLARAPAAQASLLLNFEGVLTAVLAWLIFKEHFDRRIATGMGLITMGAFALAWQPADGLGVAPGALLILVACLGWAVDNNLTRKVSGGDPLLIAAVKGAAAGTVNLGIALAGAVRLPDAGSIFGAGLVGFFGYGVSLVFFVRALRDLGAARTGAYFSTAPFLGAVASLAALGEPFTPRLAIAGALMALGVWLHVSEAHDHEHTHEELQHEHLHRHDEHHAHAHVPGTPTGEPHSHVHTHAPLRHTHSHYPDLHHRHGH
jgi:drug/metabolite transporter (DMT)-like permease